MTIDQAQSAGYASDSDTFWVGQTSNLMLRQTLGALWPWMSAKLPTWKRAVIELTTNTSLGTNPHNSSVVVCSSPVTISVDPVALGDGFSCELINLTRDPLHYPEISSPRAALIFFRRINVPRSSASLTRAATSFTHQ